MLLFLLCCRYKKLEEQRVEKEHQFYLEQAKLETERRREEREHKLKIFSMLIGNQNHPSSSSSFSQPPSSNESFVQNQYSNYVVNICFPKN